MTKIIKAKVEKILKEIPNTRVLLLFSISILIAALLYCIFIFLIAK